MLHCKVARENQATVEVGGKALKAARGREVIILCSGDIGSAADPLDGCASLKMAHR